MAAQPGRVRPLCQISGASVRSRSSGADRTRPSRAGGGRGEGSRTHHLDGILADVLVSSGGGGRAGDGVGGVSPPPPRRRPAHPRRSPPPPVGALHKIPRPRVPLVSSPPPPASEHPS